MRNHQREEKARNALLELFSKKTERIEYLNSVVALLKDWSQCSKIGIRILSTDGNIPFQSTVGYGEDFLESECWLALHIDNCICTRVVLGEPTESDEPYMTSFGSFYSGTSVHDFKSMGKAELALYRARCLRENFNSLGVIPIHYRDDLIGAIHLADENENTINRTIIDFIEAMSPLIGEAIHRFNVEDELQKSEQRFRFLAENSPAVIWQLDLQGNYIYLSPSIEDLLGYTVEEAMTLTMKDRLEPTDYDAAMSLLMEELQKDPEERARSRTLEFKQRRKDGHVVWTEVQVRLIEDTNGNITGLQGSTTNISPRKRAELERTVYLHKLEELTIELERANQIKNEFLANVSHELRTPLNSTMGLLKLIIDGLYDDDKELMDFVTTSHITLQGLTNIVNDILSLSQMQAGNIEFTYVEIPVEDICIKIESDYRSKIEGKGLEFNISNKVEQRVLVGVDWTNITLVIHHILENSIKFTNEGKIDIEVTQDEANDLIRFEVNDTGIGIEQDYEKDPFAPFVQLDGSTTREHGGTGLGLTISKIIIEKIGGQISIRSPGKDQGTTIEFTLPIYCEVEDDVQTNM